MSRALNLNAGHADVAAAAERFKARITAVEALHPSGTRVVFSNADSAARIARHFRGKIVSGQVVRTPLKVRGAIR